ncbi:hypothetical protein BH23PLA1_BH23PLA1_43880 [soil metagenome]
MKPSASEGFEEGIDVLTLPDFLTREWYGAILLRGHRIGLEQVVVFLNRGESVEQIGSRFPSLPPGLIGDVIAFYEANRDEVNAYVARSQAEIDRQRAESVGGPSLEELRRRRHELASRKG